MCGLVSAEPSAAGCGVWAMRPSGVTRSDSRSRPRLPRGQQLLFPAVDQGRQPPLENAIDPRRGHPSCHLYLRAWHPSSLIAKKDRGSPEAHMLVRDSIRRVAIWAGCARPSHASHTAYAGTDNQELLTAALRAMVERYRLQGQRLGDVIAGAVIKHPKDFNLTRESLLSTGLDPADPGPGRAARLWHQPGGGHSDRQQDRARPDRCRHRRRRRRPERPAGGVPEVVPAPAAASVRGRSVGQRLKPWLGLRRGRSQAGAAGGGRAAHRSVHGRRAASSW